MTGCSIPCYGVRSVLVDLWKIKWCTDGVHTTREKRPGAFVLGIDLWTAAGTPVYAPWDATVHSWRDNEGFGDYGPTIILKHTIADQSFFTLYGHLSRSSLTTLTVGQTIGKNERVGEIGPYPENGDWPPHLHFQVITDLQGWVGDFPGVVAPSRQDYYAKICLDPALLINIERD